jgi:hypothetical protein
MERNADDMFGATGDQGSATGGSSSVGSGGTGISGSSAPPGGLDYSTSPSGATVTTSQTTPASKADQAKATVQEKLGQVKDKARELQSTLADRLDAGAEKLRQRNQGAPLAGATDGGAAVGVSTDDRMTNVQDSVARGMQKSADWLRNGDLKADIERQVRENPGRTLLIALGLGYVLGKAFRNPNR